MKYTHIICHYSEIGLKGKNRPFFVKLLRKNIKSSINSISYEVIKDIYNTRDRIIISLYECDGKIIDNLTPILSNIFGIAYFCPTLKIDTNITSIKDQALLMLKDESFDSFRITARVSSSVFSYSKMKLHELVGSFVQENLNKKVNLTKPDINCYIDVINEGTFIYKNKIYGKGGMPVGTGGKGVVLLSGGIDSPVAAYYLLKRGMSLVYLHYHSLPHVSPASIEKVKELVEVLSIYQKWSKCYMIPFASIQENIMEHTNEKFRILLYRRFMMRIANKIAINERAKAIITGEALGQVASQTVENIGAVDTASNLPVFRPLIGLDKQEIINTANKINTYQISIRPHEDCCTLFLPQNPATKTTTEKLDFEENKLDFNSLIETALKEIDLISV